MDNATARALPNRGWVSDKMFLGLSFGDYVRSLITPGNLIVARLAVPAGAVAYLGHPEHGYLGIGPGTYELRRQREQADELRMVAD